MGKWLIKLCALVLVSMSFILCGCEDKEAMVSKADSQSDTAKKKYEAEIGKTKEDERIVCYKKGETYESYYVAIFKNDKMAKRVEYRLYFDKEVRGKKCFDIDMEFYEKQENFKKADKDLKVVIFEQEVSEKENPISFEEWYNEKLDSDYQIIE